MQIVPRFKKKHRSEFTENTPFQEKNFFSGVYRPLTTPGPLSLWTPLPAPTKPFGSASEFPLEFYPYIRLCHRGQLLCIRWDPDPSTKMEISPEVEFWPLVAVSMQRI